MGCPAHLFCLVLHLLEQAPCHNHHNRGMTYILTCIRWIVELCPLERRQIIDDPIWYLGTCRQQYKYWLSRPNRILLTRSLSYLTFSRNLSGSACCFLEMIHDHHCCITNFIYHIFHTVHKVTIANLSGNPGCVALFLHGKASYSSRPLSRMGSVPSEKLLWTIAKIVSRPHCRLRRIDHSLEWCDYEAIRSWLKSHYYELSSLSLNGSSFQERTAGTESLLRSNKKQ